MASLWKVSIQRPQWESLTEYDIVGLFIEGAMWSDDRLQLNAGDKVRLSTSQLRWVQEAASKPPAGTRMVNLPVYLNGDRSDVLFTVDMPFEGESSVLAAMRAVCLSAG